MESRRDGTKTSSVSTLTRRSAMLLVGAGLAASGAPWALAGGLGRRAIPGTGEAVPMVGLGTWQAFDTPAQGAEYAAAADALRAFLDRGGRLIDTSPMYGSAEARLGEMLGAVPTGKDAFIATKVWTRGREEGRRQLQESMRLLRRSTLDLVQVHNLLDFDVHWPMLQAARDAGQVRYLGITHHQASAHADLERVMRQARPAFVQVNYSLAEPEAAARLLPAARDLGVAVLVNRPFIKGAMIDRAQGKRLPPVADELGCRSAAQLFLKWVLGDPAVTVALAGTRNARHAVENLEAAETPLPDARQRGAIESWYASL